jgi:hypothetical protein
MKKLLIIALVSLAVTGHLQGFTAGKSRSNKSFVIKDDKPDG